jgi:hypothetical protein
MKPSSKVSDLQGVAAFSPDDKREIAISEDRTEGMILGFDKFGLKEKKPVQVGLLSWNIGDGKSASRAAVMNQVFHGSFGHIGLLCFQECSWKPHQGNELEIAPISDYFSEKVGLIEGYSASYGTDSCSRYLVNSFSGEFVDRDIDNEVLVTKNEIITTIGNRRNVLISKLEHQDSRLSFYLLNVHATRGDSDFNNQILRLVCAIFSTLSAGERVCSGVILCGDFNMDLSSDQKIHFPSGISVLITDPDPYRPSRPVDFVGFASSHVSTIANLVPAQVTVSRAALYNIKHCGTEIFDIDYQVDAADLLEENGKLLNHPIIVSAVNFHT